MMTRLKKLMDDLRVTRRICVAFTLTLTWVTYQFVFTAVLAGHLNDLGMAAILAPVSALQAAVFKFYGDR